MLNTGECQGSGAQNHRAQNDDNQGQSNPEGFTRRELRSLSAERKQLSQCSVLPLRRERCKAKQDEQEREEPLQDQGRGQFTEALESRPVFCRAEAGRVLVVRLNPNRCAGKAVHACVDEGERQARFECVHAEVRGRMRASWSLVQPLAAIALLRSRMSRFCFQLTNPDPAETVSKRTAAAAVHRNCPSRTHSVHSFLAMVRISDIRGRAEVLVSVRLRQEERVLLVPPPV